MPSPDGVQFVHEVYPLLLRDCGFPACHGAPERFLRVLGPGRVRETNDIELNDAPLLREVELSYARAVSMLATSDEPVDSLLLRKPLALAAGGQTHVGVDTFGQNLFRDRSDDDYQLLLAWALSHGEPPDADAVDRAFTDALAARELLEAAP